WPSEGDVVEAELGLVAGRPALGRGEPGEQAAGGRRAGGAGARRLRRRRSRGRRGGGRSLLADEGALRGAGAGADDELHHPLLGEVEELGAALRQARAALVAGDRLVEVDGAALEAADQGVELGERLL